MSTRHTPRKMTLSLQGLTSQLAPPTTLARIQGVWRQAVGLEISEAAQPAFERNGALIVECCSSVWAAELSLMAPTVIEHLNEALGEELISVLRCRTR